MELFFLILGIGLASGLIIISLGVYFRLTESDSPLINHTTIRTTKIVKQTEQDK